MRRAYKALLVAMLLIGTYLPVLPTVRPLTRSDARTLNPGQNNLRSAVIDAIGGFAYFGTYTSPGIVVKVRLSNFTPVGAPLTLNAGENYLSSAVLDSANGFAYFGTDTSQGVVVKVRLSNFTRVSALSLNSGESGVRSAVLDTASGFAYFGTITVPGIVVKVRLSNFTRVRALTLNSAENYLYSALLDTTSGFAYFGTETSPGIVVKIRLSDFTRVGALTLNAGENSLVPAVIDMTGGLAYFGTDTSPGIVVKVQVASSPSSPTGLTAKWSGGKISLSWMPLPPALNGDRGITGYNIYRSQAKGPSQLLASVLMNQTNWDDTSVVEGPAPYSYTLTAKNSIGESSFSNEAVVSPFPVAPVFENPLRDPNSGVVILVWDPPSSPFPINGYNLYRYNITLGRESLLKNLGNVTRYDDTNVTKGTTYRYEVTAVNDVGEGAVSSEVSVPPYRGVSTLPAVPIILSAITVIAAIQADRHRRRRAIRPADRLSKLG